MFGTLSIPTPIRPPTCWEFFGFSGPTNKHNLEECYRERQNAITPAGIENSIRLGWIDEQYKRCLQELA
jgi:hypothetical protein